ncbi:kinase-like domain-containing protein [Talaromyces proteolyticus]|uniref:Kinase-like domain-containing protein n=1 Tax=Talaromyces proteolyticus TaxID=1131652 RepID=A0AAD4KKW4_9EURO|nr:kinase-like domain-containing protein [Talaromyces proteolyticus]KAH8691546.1 kinase-like domain-containing protein [Talaromyces proteolyticus]
MYSTRLSIPRLSALRRKKPFPMPSRGPPLSPGILVDEEITPVYNSKYFYPAKPGEVLADRYQIMVKVGWGVSSTVWLARDLQGHIEEPDIFVALKIANNNASPVGHEREVEEYISTANPSHRGRSLIRTLLDSFEVNGPEGSYSCLVYPLMREPLSMYQQRFDDRKMPLALMKIYVRALLTGLEYLHKECRIIHSDLKLENIMVSFEDQSVLADFMDSQFEKPMAFKIDSTGRPVYQSRNNFGPLKSLRSIPQLVDFGLAVRLEEDDDWGVWPIQSDHYRAPEVILGNGWQMPADIWNLGVLLWDMIKGKELFRHIHDQKGQYNAKLHVAEIIALLGPPPPEIIQRYQYMREYSWPEPVRREDDRVCETAEEYFCGPFFDNDGITGFPISNELLSGSRHISGRFLYEDLIPNRKLGDTVSFLEGEEKEGFLDLTKKMLIWHPDARQTAGELAGHPFLQPKQTST